MANEFEYSGGVTKPSTHTVEKFLLFFVVDGREVPMYQLERDTLVMKATTGGNKYLTGLTVGKLFCGFQGFGVPRRFHSFYFRFVDGSAEKVTIRPFTVADKGPSHSEMFFSGKIRFLNRTQVLGLLQEGQESRHFVERQAALPLDVLHKMIQVERTEVKDVRHVRIGAGRKKGNLSGLPMAEEE